MRRRGPYALLAAALGAVGCAGSQAGFVAPPPRPVQVTARPSAPPESAEPPAALRQLFVRCEDPRRCPAAVGMVVGSPGEVGADGQPNRCTGALVAPDRLLTAAHCLPRAARGAGRSCRGTWIAFPATATRPMEWAACDEVIDAPPVADTEVLRPDWAVVRLAGAVGRERLEVDPSDPPAHAIVQVVSVSPHPIYRTQHAVGTRLCRVRTTAEARVLFGPEAARVGWLSDCPTVAGNSGAPVLDYHGRVRGILHGGSGPLAAVGVTTPVPRGVLP